MKKTFFENVNKFYTGSEKSDVLQFLRHLNE